MADLAVRCERLGKLYRTGHHERYKTLSGALTNAVCGPIRRIRQAWKSPADEAPNGGDAIWALKDVGFEVKRGEVVGIIGRNGAGKTTLLKVLSRITEPTGGRAEVFGRVGSLLEVGTGFHPELTGRENIYLNGAILGMKKKEIGAKFDEIVNFAEVERFIDMPVKRYSTGMQTRLAFAVAAHLEPEVLLVDEVLAVGDIAFQRKCMGKMKHVARAGRTLLFVSHNLVAVSNLCSRALLLENGRLSHFGATEDIVSDYLLTTGLPPSTVDLESVPTRGGSGRIRFTACEIRSVGADNPYISSGDSFFVRLHFRVHDQVRRPVFSIAVYNMMNIPVFAVHSSDHGFEIPRLDKDGCVEITVDRANLMPGNYFLHIAVGDETSPHVYDHVLDAASLEIKPADVYGSGKLRSATWSVVFLNCSWRLLN